MPDLPLYAGIPTELNAKTNQYCGVVYKLRPFPFACLTAQCSWNEEVVYRFTGNPDGWAPNAHLVSDPAGNLYVTSSTPDLCGHGQGNVFSLSAPDWNPSTLASFQGRFLSWITTDALGNVYGTNAYGGSDGNVFKLTCCWTYTDLHDFTGSPNDGQGPAAAPVVDAQGNIYGTTAYGGAYGYGVVWKISP